MKTTWYEAIRTVSNTESVLARDMHTAGIRPSEMLDFEPVQRHLLEMQHAWAGSVYHVHAITNAILDILAQAEGYADWFDREIAVRHPRRARRSRECIST
jgi:hypothetical protein